MRSCAHWTSLLKVGPHYLIENIQPLFVSFVLFWFVLTLSNVSIRHVLLCHRNLLTLDTWYGRCPEQYRLYQRLTSTDNASRRVASCSITTRSMITLLGLLVEPLCFLYRGKAEATWLPHDRTPGSSLYWAQVFRTEELREYRRVIKKEILFSISSSLNPPVVWNRSMYLALTLKYVQ